MKRGMELLLEVLRNNMVAFSVAEPEWCELLAAAKEHHVLPFVASRIRVAQLVLPDAIANELAAVERGVAMVSFFWSSELRGLLRAFETAGVPLLPLKGPSLAARVYGEPTLRSSRDLDLLVRRQDRETAEALLVRLGFSPSAPPDDYHQPWLRGSCTVELHHDVENPIALDFGVDAGWAKAHEGEFLGEAAWQLAPADEFLFLALHGVRHRFDRLSLVLDLALAVECFGREAALGPLRCRHDVRLQAVLQLATELARRLRPAAVGATCQRSAHIERLADRLWQGLLSEAPVELDWQAQHVFYVELEQSFMARTLARVGHARILAGRVIAPDYDFAARFGLTRTWQAWLLRPVRLAASRFSRMGS
jgi:hypothetical protein